MIRILGCSGSVMKGFNTTSILINGRILIDAGSAASLLSDDELSQIKNIFLTHSHIDHIKELPFILDCIFSRRSSGVTIWASAQTIKALKNNVFNGLIWPHIDELVGEKGSLLVFRNLDNEVVNISDMRIKAIGVNHIPGSVGLMVSEGDKCVFFSGDTGYSDGLLDFLQSFNPRLKACFIETSFPDRLRSFANTSHHLTPSMAWEWLGQKISPTTRIIAYHIKPRYLDEVIDDLNPSMEYIVGGEDFEF